MMLAVEPCNLADGMLKPACSNLRVWVARTLKEKRTLDTARRMAPPPPWAASVTASSAASISPTMTDSTMIATRCALPSPPPASISRKRHHAPFSKRHATAAAGLHTIRRAPRGRHLMRNLISPVPLCRCHAIDMLWSCHCCCRQRRHVQAHHLRAAVLEARCWSGCERRRRSGAARWRARRGRTAPRRLRRACTLTGSRRGTPIPPRSVRKAKTQSGWEHSRRSWLQQHCVKAGVLKQRHTK